MKRPIGLLLLLAGCTVGPDYAPPAQQVPSQFAERPGATRALEQAWWKILEDSVLDGLIAGAMTDSPDLDVAAGRIEEARAEAAAVGAADWPHADADAGYRRQHGSAHVPVGTPPGGIGPNIGSNRWLVGFDSGWEIDVFGGRRRAIESASATLEAVTADRRDAELSLTAEIARDYIALRAEQRRLQIARDVVEIRRDLVKLVAARFDSGLAGAVELARARAELEAGDADLANRQAGERSAIYRLGILVGRPPEELLPLLAPPRPIPAAAQDVPVGLPSDLLRRRPDIRAAERRVAAANARIGMVEADLYPHFALTGAIGFESLHADNFLTGPSRYLTIGPSVDWLVFDAGRVRDEALAEHARTDQAAARYRKAVLGALAEVEAALVAHGQTLAARQSLARELAADRQALELARTLYGKGLEDFLTVLDAERAERAAEFDLAKADEDCAASLVALIKALGGGWQD